MNEPQQVLTAREYEEAATPPPRVTGEVASESSSSGCRFHGFQLHNCEHVLHQGLRGAEEQVGKTQARGSHASLREANHGAGDEEAAHRRAEVPVLVVDSTNCSRIITPVFAVQ